VENIQLIPPGTTDQSFIKDIRRLVMQDGKVTDTRLAEDAIPVAVIVEP